MEKRRWGIAAWLCLLHLPTFVFGAYNCSKSHILDSSKEDFEKNLKETCTSLEVYLYKQPDMKLNLSTASDGTSLNMYMWGGCDVQGPQDMCRECIVSQCEQLLDTCNGSSWGELEMVVSGKQVCFVHYNGIDYMEDADASVTLVHKYRHSLLFFLLWHLFMLLSLLIN